MMRRLAALVFSWTCLVWAGAALAQPGRELRVQVFHLGENGEKVYESGVVVTWQETGSHRETTDQGMARLPVPPAFRPGAKITLGVDKPQWRIRYPLDGETLIPASLGETIKVELLPAGSRLFWTNDRIEKFIQDTAEKAKMEAQPRQREAGAARGSELDLGRYIQEWAVRYGFTPQDAQKEVDRWIAETEANQADVHRLGLAAFAKNKFAEAARHFRDSADQDARQIEEIHRRREALAEREAQLRVKQVGDLRLEGDSHLQAGDYEKALAAYEEAHAHTSRDGTASLWAATLNDIAEDHWHLGNEGSSAASQAHLDQTVLSSRQVLQVCTREQLPQDWARAQNNLANALQNQGTRADGERGSQLLADAVEAYKQALLGYTREQFPRGWAMTQNNLGCALMEQGKRTEGPQSSRLLAEAVATFRQALLVRTREQLPLEWAMTQINLGNAFLAQGERTEGQRSTQLLADAAAAYSQALLVYTREQHPLEWAKAQNNLGVAVLAQGKRSEGQRAAQLLADAAAAYRQALLVYTREKFAQGWAMTQDNLGSALLEQGTRTEGENGARLLAEAIEAYEQTLLVRTREQMPQDWAATQSNLGTALTEQGKRTEGQRGTELLADAVKAHRQALLVYTREQLPQGWARIENNLGNALELQGTRTEGQRGAQLLAEAVAANEQALLVYTRGQFPLDWAITQNNLGNALMEQGARSEGERASQLFAQAGMAFRLALEVFNQEQFPRQWAAARSNESLALLHTGRYQEAVTGLSDILNRNPTDAVAFQMMIGALNDYLFDHRRALTLIQQWLAKNPGDPSARSMEVEVLFANGDFADCRAKTASLLATPGLSANFRVVSLGYEAAVEMATGSAKAGEALANLMKEVAAQPAEFSTDSDFPGTLHALQEHPEIPHRDWLVRLFKSLEAQNRESLTQGLQALQAEVATSR